MKITIAAGAAAAFVLLAPSAGAAAVDYFIKIPGVDGEARDRAHSNWIIVESLDWRGYRLDREAGAVRFGDGAHGRRPPSGSSSGSSSGDPDRPVIVGSAPNPQTATQYNQSDLEFVVSRASRASPKLMQYCVSGKHVAKVEIDQVENGERAVRYILHNPRFVSFVSGDVRLTAPSASSAAARSQSSNNRRQMTLAARSLTADPKVRLVYDCADWINYKTGAKGGDCAVSETRGDVILKGSKIKEN